MSALPNGSDVLSVSPGALRDAAPTYANASQDISTLMQGLVTTVQLEMGELVLIYEFAQLVTKLEQLQARIETAMQCASLGLNRISDALVIASEEFPETDDAISKDFTNIEDDTHPWTANLRYPGYQPSFEQPPTIKPDTPAIEPPVTKPDVPEPAKKPDIPIHLPEPAKKPDIPIHLPEPKEKPDIPINLSPHIDPSQSTSGVQPISTDPPGLIKQQQQKNVSSPEPAPIINPIIVP